MGLLETLRRQHGEIEGIVDRVNAALDAADPEGIRAALGDFTLLLLAHLQLEAGQIYPALMQAAEQRQEPRLSETARAFATNLQHLHAALHALVSRHSGMELDLVGFRRDWSRLAEMLLARLAAEDETLYRMYAEIAASPALPAPEPTAGGDRRSSSRVPVSGTACSLGPPTLLGKVADVSAGGMFLQMPARLFPIGQAFTFRVVLPGSADLHQIKAEVRHHRSESGAGEGIGVRFLRLPPTTQKAIGRLLEARRGQG